MDLTIWACLCALVWTFAIGTFSAAGLIPAEFHGFLHGARVDPQSIMDLKSGVAKLYQTTTALEAQTGNLMDRLNGTEADQRTVADRLGRIEDSFPTLSAAAESDPMITGSTDTPVTRLEVPGGAIEVTQLPLGDAIDRLPAEDTPVDLNLSHGIALGPAIAATDASAEWATLVNDAGNLLLGLRPLLSLPDESGQSRVIVGPIADSFTAGQICERLDAIGIACTPEPYTGTPLEGLATEDAATPPDP
jgi:hypothetical protein